MLRLFISKFTVVYFDDILIYSKSLDEHVEHLQNVCEVLCMKSLYANLIQFTFCMKKIMFLGYIISARGFKMGEGKVKVIQECLALKSIIEVRTFHFWLVSIESLLRILEHLLHHSLTLSKSQLLLNGGIEQDNVFNLLKEKICSTPLLALPNFTKAFKIE